MKRVISTILLILAVSTSTQAKYSGGSGTAGNHTRKILILSWNWKAWLCRLCRQALNMGNAIKVPMKKKTLVFIQLVCLLSVSLLFVKPATATSSPCAPESWSYETTAVVITAYVSGGNASSKPGSTGGNGGRIIVKTGVPVDTGSGSDGPLTKDVTLYSGTYNYTRTSGPAHISIDGDVIIKCMGDFRSNVQGVFHPDQPPPCVRIYAGHPDTFFHLIGADMTERSYRMFNSDGSGMDGGILEFYTTEAGDLWSGSQAKGGYGGDSGKGGDGGEITLVANGGIVASSAVSAYGANGGWGPNYYSFGFGNGGAGGDGGKILISGLGFSSGGGIASLSVNGGDGGSAYGGSYPCGSRGGRGGSGGAIVIAAPLCPTNTYTASATGGNGGSGGVGPDNWGGAVKDGFLGGDGGSGGAPGVMIGITGFTTPGNGGNGGSGGLVFTGNVPPIGIGGAGGNGGNSGGTGAVPGIGGPGGHNNSSLNGDGPRGEDGIVENLPPPKPPMDSTSHFTYVLCVGTYDYDVTRILAHQYTYLDGDRGAQFVCDAFNKLSNINLKARTIRLDTSTPNNGASVYRAIIEAANRLSPGDNFIFYINCHGLTDNGDIAIGLSRLSNQLYPQWQYDVTDDVFTRWFSSGVWPNVHKLFIMDCCHALRFWNKPPDDNDDLASLKDVGILAACDRDTISVATNDVYNPYAVWGVLGQSLVLALDNLSTRNVITFDELVQTTKDMGARNAETNGVFNGIIQDESTNFSINATCVWAPVWANTSDFAMIIGDSNGDSENPFQVTKCAVAAGSKTNSDAISFSGTMNATADDFATTNVVITIDSNDMASPLVKTFPITGNFKKDKFKCSASNASFALDTKTSKFSFTAKNVDLSGLSCPLTVQIKIGDYEATVEVDETIVNGKNRIPINLLMGVKNSLRVNDKPKFTRNKKTGQITQVAISGWFSVKDTIDMVANSFSVSIGTQIFTIPANTFKNAKGKFTCSKVNLAGGIIATTFDSNKCTFTLTIKGTKITDPKGAANFKMEFGGFSEGAEVSLP